VPVAKRYVVQCSDGADQPRLFVSLVMDLLKLRRVVKSTVNGKKFQTLTTQMAKKVTTDARTTSYLCDL